MSETTAARSGAQRGDGLVVAAPLRLEARALLKGAPGLRIVRTGSGPARARRAARRLREDPARLTAVAGLCGALDPALVPGDVVVASELWRSDGARLGVSCEKLCRAIEQLGLRAHPGPIVSLDHVVRGAERELLRGTGARAADMESAWLAAGASGRPLAVLRVVLDAPGHEIMRPALLRNGLRALRVLRVAAPALERWARAIS